MSLIFINYVDTDISIITTNKLIAESVEKSI